MLPEAPGIGTPEAGGIRALHAIRLLRALRGADVIGADLGEVSPPFDVGAITVFNAASGLFEILYTSPPPRGRGGASARSRR